MTDMSRTRSQIGSAQLVNQLEALGVREGDVLLVHTSFRAVRPVEGGPTGLIEALRQAIGGRGTLVMPSWGNDSTPFARGSTPAHADLGVVADTFWRLHGVLRSNHVFAFAAAGPHAERITSDPLPLPPHRLESPVGRVYELDGKVLLLGVNHDSDTTIHLAELLADVPYRVPKQCLVLQDGQPVRIKYGENDHCCQRFTLADEWLREGGHQREGLVGHAQARLARSRDIVSTTVQRLKENPFLFLHEHGTGCGECEEAWLSVVARPRRSLGRSLVSDTNSLVSDTKDVVD